VIALPLAGCAFVSAREAKVPEGPRPLDRASPAERRAYFRRAQVWQATPVGSLDLLAGPPGPDAFRFEEEVTCDFAPEVRSSGKTPKFYCTVAPGDTVKVKFGRDNREVYSEVMASRLFWALGFGADRQYPARVTCRGCSADPWRKRELEPGSSPTFHPAVIERDPPGRTIEVRGTHKGWEWWELQTIDERVGGAPQAHVDALRLLAAFVQHVDNKDEQQRLVCLPGGVARNAAGHETCTAPFLFTVDLGSMFGRGSMFGAGKTEFEAWDSVPMWSDRERCIAKLRRKLLTGTMGNVGVGEAGRAFLAGLLMQLSDRQIRDLFVAARVEEMGERIKGDDGRERPVTVEDWIGTFLRKRREIADVRCLVVGLSGGRPRTRASTLTG
jgi:hypothetical protein